MHSNMTDVYRNRLDSEETILSQVYIEQIYLCIRPESIIPPVCYLHTQDAKLELECDCEERKRCTTDNLRQAVHCDRRTSRFEWFNANGRASSWESQ